MKSRNTCLKYELKKLFINDKGCFIILIALILHLGVCLNTKPNLTHYDFDTSLYQQTVPVYSGPYQAGMSLNIENALKAAEARINAYSRRPQKADENLIERAKQLSFAQEDAAVLRAIIKKYDSLKIIKDMNPELTYDLEFIDYIQRFGINWASLVCILILMPMLMLRDSTYGMEQLLFASCIGKKGILRAKLLIASIISVFITTLFSLLQFLILCVRWNFGSLDVSLQSITGFESCKIHCSVFGALIIAWIIRIIASLIAALIICFIALLIRKEIASIIIFIVLLGFGALLFNHNNSLSLYGSLQGIANFRNESGGNIYIILLFLIIRLFGIIFVFFCCTYRRRKHRCTDV